MIHPFQTFVSITELQKDVLEMSCSENQNFHDDKETMGVEIEYKEIISMNN